MCFPIYHPAASILLSAHSPVVSFGPLNLCLCRLSLFHSKSINSGIPQGSVLSSTLFLLHTDDLSTTSSVIQASAGEPTLHYSPHWRQGTKHPWSVSDSRSKLHISSPTKWASSNLSILYRLKGIFSPHSCLHCAKTLSTPACSIQVICVCQEKVHSRLNRVETRAFCLISFLVNLLINAAVISIRTVFLTYYLCSSTPYVAFLHASFYSR